MELKLKETPADEVAVVQPAVDQSIDNQNRNSGGKRTPDPSEVFEL